MNGGCDVRTCCRLGGLPCRRGMESESTASQSCFLASRVLAMRSSSSDMCRWWPRSAGGSCWSAPPLCCRFFADSRASIVLLRRVNRCRFAIASARWRACRVCSRPTCSRSPRRFPISPRTRRPQNPGEAASRHRRVFCWWAWPGPVGRKIVTTAIARFRLRSFRRWGRRSVLDSTACRRIARRMHRLRYRIGPVC